MTLLDPTTKNKSKCVYFSEFSPFFRFPQDPPQCLHRNFIHLISSEFFLLLSRLCQSAGKSRLLNVFAGMVVARGHCSESIASAFPQLPHLSKNTLLYTIATILKSTSCEAQHFNGRCSSIILCARILVSFAQLSDFRHTDSKENHKQGKPRPIPKRAHTPKWFF